MLKKWRVTQKMKSKGEVDGDFLTEGHQRGAAANVKEKNDLKTETKKTKRKTPQKKKEEKTPKRKTTEISAPKRDKEPEQKSMTKN